jgi:NAD(P)H-dependent FMN reductase
MSNWQADNLFIPVVLGSIRANRRSYRPAYLLAERVVAAGHRTDVVDLRTLDLPMFGQLDDPKAHPAVATFRQTLAEADAVILLTPEYNHGYSSAMKNALDYLSDELRRKPVAVCGLSGGMLGGARAVEQLKLVVIELRAVPIRDSVYFSDAAAIFDADGALQHTDYLRRIDQTLGELTWYARALGAARRLTT